jgi:lipopolysaccharide exporter
LAFSFASRWFKSGAFSLLNRLVIVAFGFQNIYYMVRLLPKSEIGVWSLFISVTSVLELLRNGFIRNPMITHLVSAHTEKDRGDVISASWVLHGMLVGVTSMIMLAIAVPLANFWKAPELDVLFYVYILRGIVLIPCLQFEYLQQSQTNFKAIFMANLARLAPTGIYLMYKFVEVQLLHQGTAPTLVDISIAQLVSAIISLWVGHYYLRGTKLIYPNINWKTVIGLSHFGKYTMGTTMSSMFIKNTDSWMIGRMISTDGVASYNPALRISNLIEVPTLAVASLVFPQVNKKMKEGGNEGVEDVYVKSVSVILAMMLPFVIPMYFMADFIIRIIFTSNYMEAAPILQVTLFFTLIIPFNRQFGTVMDALKRPKINFYLLVMMGVLNVIFNYFLIGKYGPIGAAYGTLFSYIIIFILNQIILRKLYGIDTFKVFPAIFGWYRTIWTMVVKMVFKRA